MKEDDFDYYEDINPDDLYGEEISHVEQHRHLSPKTQDSPEEKFIIDYSVEKTFDLRFNTENKLQQKIVRRTFSVSDKTYESKLVEEKVEWVNVDGQDN